MVRRDQQMANYYRLRAQPRYVGLSLITLYGQVYSHATESISFLEPHCSEFLIHAADVEGLQRGIDHELVSKLAEWCTIPVTYAGGGRSLDDLELVKELSKGKVDLTIGSALDIFGGSGVKFEECVKWNKAQ
jgi:phosphoribosylformimino-5-aminoimidazole carboxamide ribotide isomerase